MDFKEYQERARATDRVPKAKELDSEPLAPHRYEVVPLLGLVGEVGSLLGEYKKLLRDGGSHRRFRDEVAEELGDILWYLANVATKFDLTLDEVAEKNLVKVEDRWKPPGGERVLYDRENPKEQQLPRRFEYGFEEQTANGARRVVLVDRIDGESTGDSLTDNSYEDDGYRFHDVMHLVFAARLGWSPVLRKLLRKKGQITNRTPLEVDEVEDGGRAQVIEEAIVAAAYVYAAEHNFLEGIETVDWQLLRHIKQLTAHLETKNRSTWDWNDVLVCGFKIWRDLRDHGGGVVRGNVESGTIEFTPLSRPK